MITLEKENIQLINYVGQKANNIAKLNDLGYNVPKAFALEPQYFYELIKENKKENYFKKSLEKPENFELSEEVIENLHETKSITGCLDTIDKMNLYPVIVRSSASDEDGFYGSKAGIYTSIGSCFTKQQLFEAIKKCWVSSFSPLAKKYGAGYEPIPLIIQEMVESDYSGVAFSVEPLSQDNKFLTISLVQGSTDGIESGTLSGVTYVVDKERRKVTNNESFRILSEKSILKIASMVIKMEKDLNWGGIDVEWGIKNNELFVFQVRPVIEKNCDAFPRIISLEDEACIRVEIDQLGTLHKRWFRKKYWCRKEAQKQGINIPKGYYITYKPSDISKEDIQQVLEDLKCDFIILDRSVTRRTIFVPHDELLFYLKNEKEYKNDFVTVRLRELPKFEISGFSSFVDDKKLLIEYVPGAFSGIYEYELVPSQYLVDSNNNVLQKKIHTYEERCEFDSADKKFLLRSSRETAIELKGKHISEIRRITKIMSEKYGEPRIEWTIIGEKVVLFDISIERNPICNVGAEHRVLSNGDFEGKVFKVGDIKKIKSICDVHTISVDFEQSYYEAKETELVKNYIDEIKAIGNKVVVVAKQPRTELALLKDNVAAFVFEEGSVLCHLGIILRESGIPAIFVENACGILNNRDEVCFMDNEMRIVNKNEQE